MSNTAFDYQIIRAKRKTVAIHIRNGAVEVRAPLRVSKRWINEFVVSKSNWVIKKLREKPRAGHVIADGATINFLGSPVTIQTTLSPRPSALFENHQLTLNVTANNPDNIKALFVEWLTEQAAGYMVPRAAALAEELGVADKLQRIRFRITRSTWGHCSGKGVIQFNPLIMLAPTSVIDYLITHEVCHLRFMNHSPRYWALVAGICNDYKSAQKSLRALEPFLLLEK